MGSDHVTFGCQTTSSKSQRVFNHNQRMDQPGLLEWCNSTRFTMANDPGRQLFHDQIQTHGFLFLTDYLDNIRAGSRRDPLIELVKTPGRKKATTKRPVVAASALKSVVSVSLEDEHDSGSKENLVPVNSFHRALLQTKEKTPQPQDGHVLDTTESSQELADSMDQDPPTLPSFAVVRAVTRPPSPPRVDEVDFGQAPEATEPQLLAALPLDQSDLSAIAEDDETDRSRASLRDSHVSELGLPAAQLEAALPEDTQANSVEEPVIEIPSSSSVATVQAIPLSPTQLAESPSINRSPAPSHHSPVPSRHSPAPSHHLPAPSHPSPASPDMSQTRPPSPTGKYTVPLPEIPPWHPRDKREEITEPLPSLPAPAETDNTEMLDVPLRPHTSPKGLAHKPSLPSFPTLPAPLPFRKSIRAPPESLGAATPGNALAGKRTSWLMRAREVKALEITVKKPSPAPSFTPGSSSSNKRKSGDMFGVSGTTGLEGEERPLKAVKNVDGDVAPMKPKTSDSAQAEPNLAQHSQPQADTGEQAGILEQLKRTVNGLGRFGKSVGGKSLGGAAAANALAEAKAAAEARIAERHHKEEEATMALGAPAVAPIHAALSTEPVLPVFRSSGVHPRLSVSDLVTSSEKKGKGKEVSTSGITVPTILPATSSADQSTTTTPPDSPSPPVFHMAPAPVFNKPPPVFVAPAAAPVNQAPTFKMPVTTAFSKPASMALGLAPRLPSPKQTSAIPLSAQSTLESIGSEGLFDSQDGPPAWMPSTQDTEYTSGFGSQSQCSPPRDRMAELDEDDSWPLDEKVPWFNVNNGKEESMTWSTLPTESQRGDTGPMPQDPGLDISHTNGREFQPIPGSFNMEIDDDDADYDDDHGAILEQSVLGEMEVDPKKSTVSLVEPSAARSQSQMSMASSASSQVQGGFLGHASKLMSSVLGTSKKGKPEVKSLQLAAVAAKKQQEEKEKKANRLKEMENRRQAALQRKADEEKAKAQDEERKLKEESERRKKEREEFTDKRPLKIVGVKKEEENTKKRKIIGEIDKKAELKKPMPKPTLNASTSSKLTSKSALKPQSALASSATYNAASTSKTVVESKSNTLQGKGKLVTKNMVPDDDISQPSQFLQTQMAARAKAQLQAANLAPQTIASENIELPDINSEYSDSDDEDRPRTFDPPSWAQSPDLRQALEIQSTINPDDIFGAIRPLKMDELFRNRTGRFRARTSSANWTGTDRLTAEEEREYARRMGFR
ncbi:hypothetical protein C8R43DRAFT_710410 [Mycena crocata]|nr:hypothetical protein C8R43DRAFT_710410 [Mycena crocata]